MNNGSTILSENQVSQFVSTLFQPDEIILLRLIESWTPTQPKENPSKVWGTWHPTQQELLDPAYWQGVLEEAAKRRANVFFGVCPRSQPFADKAEDIKTVRTLWSDIDHCTPEEALKRIAEAGLPVPSIMVLSGYGVHCYWLLKNAIGPEGVQQINEFIAKRIGGDHTTDLARILRLPGTMNRKDERNGKAPVPCSLVLCEKERRYLLTDFAGVGEVELDEVDEAAYVPPHDFDESTTSLIDRLIKACANAPKGNRSEADFFLCKVAYRSGMKPEDLWQRVKDIGKFSERGKKYFLTTWESASKAQDIINPEVETFYNELHEQKETMVNPPKKKVFTGAEFRELAKKDIVVWQTNNLIEAGAFTIFSGKPYSGKSVVVAHWIGCTLEGKPFFGHETMQSTVLYIDTDRNRIQRLKQRIGRVASDKAIDEHFFFADVDELPDSLDAHSLTTLIHEVCQYKHPKSLVVVIDTFRSAFLAASEKGSEVDPCVMLRLLKPIKRLCRKLGVTIVLLHHDPKYVGEIAGSGAIPGVTDGTWGYSRENSEGYGKLTFRTRDDTQIAPLKLSYGVDGLRLFKDDPEKELAKRLQEDKEEDELAAKICKHFPTTEGKALTLEQCLTLPCFEGIGKTTVRSQIETCERAGREPRLEKLGDGKKGNPFKWFAV